MAYLALSPVSVAVYAKLNVSALTSLVSGLGDDIAQATSFPYVWFEVRERDLRGLGTGELPEVELRTHVFSTYEGAKEAQAIARQVVELLKDASLTVSGYTQAGRVFYDETIPIYGEELNGQKVIEIVSVFRIYVEA